MIYVERDENGNIKGLYEVPQPQPDGLCLTDPKPLSEDDPEVIAFRNRPVLPKSLSDGALAALLVKENVIPQSAIDQALATVDLVATK